MNPAPKVPDESSYSGRFAQRLRQLREKAGMSVEEVVAAMQVEGYAVAARSFYHWEQGRAMPPLKCFPELASALKLKTVRSLLPEK